MGFRKRGVCGGGPPCFAHQVKRFREANKGSVQLAAVLLGDPLCNHKSRLLFGAARPIRAWYGSQSKLLRSTMAYREWLCNQVRLRFAEPLVETWRLLHQSGFLSFLGFTVDFTPDCALWHRDDPRVAQEDFFAHLAGSYVLELIGARSRRLLYLTHGWTGQQARLVSNDPPGES